MKQVSKDEFNKAVRLILQELTTEVDDSGVVIYRTPDKEVYALSVYHKINIRQVPVKTAYYIRREGY
mgnify:CR=1 FL=1|tara:strand:- start:1816 stop:2016 length:201 start_codon:yes stop_codon:yes gene_type:complete